MTNKKKVVIYGAGGYGGVGLVEILLRHPGVEISALVSREGADSPYSDLYPHLRGWMDMPIHHAEEFNPEGQGELVFFSTPDGVGQSIAPTWLNQGYKIIDFSGDFRFKKASDWKSYAARQLGNREHEHPELLELSAYGAPELYKSEIESAQIVGNPGCMAMGCLLALAPLVSNKLIESSSIICDVKTGISGAGKKPNPVFHFSHASENLFAYKIGAHQHLYELKRELSFLNQEPVDLCFTPHLVPTVRGILSTCYFKPKTSNPAEIFEASKSFFQNNEQVQVSEGKVSSSFNDIKGTNYCNLSYHYDETSGYGLAISVLDNLQKGQSGNAVQNMNIMLGFDQYTALRQYPQYP